MESFRQCVALRDLRFYAFHGYYAEEQLMGNEFYVTVEVAFNRTTSGEDQLANTVNYETLYRLVKTEMLLPRKLLETVAETIMHSIRSEFSSIDEISVDICKSHPPFGGDQAKAAVTLSWKL